MWLLFSMIILPVKKIKNKNKLHKSLKCYKRWLCRCLRFSLFSFMVVAFFEVQLPKLKSTNQLCIPRFYLFIFFLRPYAPQRKWNCSVSTRISTEQYRLLTFLRVDTCKTSTQLSPCNTLGSFMASPSAWLCLVQTVDPACFHSSCNTSSFDGGAHTHTLAAGRGPALQPRGCVRYTGLVFPATFCCHMDVEWFSMSAGRRSHIRSKQREFLRRRQGSLSQTQRVLQYELRALQLYLAQAVLILCRHLSAHIQSIVCTLRHNDIS